MKLVISILIAASLGGCAPLIIGGVAGAVIERHEANRHARCMRFYGNPDCWPGYGEHRGFFPMGVHR